MPYKYAVIWWERSKSGWAYNGSGKKPPWPRVCYVKCFSNSRKAQIFREEWAKKGRPGMYTLIDQEMVGGIK